MIRGRAERVQAGAHFFLAARPGPHRATGFARHARGGGSACGKARAHGAFRVQPLAPSDDGSSAGSDREDAEGEGQRRASCIERSAARRCSVLREDLTRKRTVQL